MRLPRNPLNAAEWILLIAILLIIAAAVDGARVRRQLIADCMADGFPRYHCVGLLRGGGR